MRTLCLNIEVESNYEAETHEVLVRSEDPAYSNYSVVDSDGDLERFVARCVQDVVELR